jgi:hypothetical protein
MVLSKVLVAGYGRMIRLAIYPIKMQNHPTLSLLE